jgi:hypothetical protein
MEFSSSVLKKLLCDPVMAAEVLMGWKLDVFQAAALRIDWWFPETIDSSGVSTGKTLRIFLLVNLRAMLLPDHVAAVYFPNFQTGKDEFWPYYEKTIQQSEIFRLQCQVYRNVIGEKKEPGAYSWHYKHGSRVIMPAPSFMQDSNTQASRRFNTLVIDDWLRSMDMGEGIDKQLVDRVTRPSFNQNHPIWCNHIHFKGHAEKPSHRGFERYKSYRRLIRDGSNTHAVYSFCFRDFSPAMAKKLRPDSTIRTQRAVLQPEQFRRQWLGLWSRDGSTYYPEGILTLATRRYLEPAMARLYDGEVNILGVDIAPGQSIKSDSSAFVNLRIVELAAAGMNLPCNFQLPGRDFNIAFTFASFLRDKSAAETSAFIHRLHRFFAFSRIVLDPGGGGLWVYKEMKRATQELDGHRFNVTPLCTTDEPITVDKQPIVHYFKRGGSFDRLPFVEPRQLVSDDGFIEACHQNYREGWEAGMFHWPLRLQDRAPAEIRGWAQEIVDAQGYLDLILQQLENVVQLTGEDGRPLVSKRGFKLFGSRGKKDGPYASLYAWVGAQLWLHSELDVVSEQDEDAQFSII